VDAPDCFPRISDAAGLAKKISGQLDGDNLGVRAAQSRGKGSLWKTPKKPQEKAKQTNSSKLSVSNSVWLQN